MSTSLRQYRFGTSPQWRQCLLHRFDVAADGSIVPLVPLGRHRVRLGAADEVSTVAVDPFGAPMWRTVAGLFRQDDSGRVAGPVAIEGPLAASPRWIVDRASLWAFASDGTVVHRYDRATLERDRSIDVSSTILDIAGDGHEGLWLLVRQASAEGMPGQDGVALVHVDCKGCERERVAMPCVSAQPTQLAGILHGARFMLLDATGSRLIVVDRSGSIQRVLHLGSLLPCWSARRLSSNGKGRAAVWGATTDGSRRSVLFVLDASGDAIDRLEDVDPPVPDSRPVDIALGTDALWMAAADGVWRLTADESAARTSEATLLTPAMLSPESDEGRGWLRAELVVDLPSGAVLEAELASTDDARLVEQARHIGADPSMTTEARERAVWTAVAVNAAQTLRVVGPTPPGRPVSIPLFSTEKRWLWLRLKLVVPAGVAPPTVHELRVFYPNLSIAQHLPAIYRGPEGDPTLFLRHLTGVLETTTQGIDRRIQAIGTNLDPETAPVDWLDFVARWLDLPWDDDLPTDAKRRLLQHAGDLLDARGTRRGVRLLIEALVGGAGRVRITDFTVDHAPVRLGGHGRRGAPLPMLLAGPSPRIAVLGGASVVGRTRLHCGDGDGNPLGNIVPTVGIAIAATRQAAADLQPLLMRLLERYVPAGVKVSVRWSVASPAVDGSDDGDPLDADGPGRVGRNASLGRTILAGRNRGRIDDSGLGIGFRLP